MTASRSISSILRLVLAAVLFADVAVAQNPAPSAQQALAPHAKFEPDSPSQIGRTRLTQVLDKIAAEYIAERAAKIASIHPRAEAEARQAKVREQILSLPPATLICPGHGPLTTVGQERAHNPFF